MYFSTVKISRNLSLQLVGESLWSKEINFVALNQKPNKPRILCHINIPTKYLLDLNPLDVYNGLCRSLCTMASLLRNELLADKWLIHYRQKKKNQIRATDDVDIHAPQVHRRITVSLRNVLESSNVFMISQSIRGRKIWRQSRRKFWGFRPMEGFL